MSMNEVVLDGDPPVAVALRRSRAARRLSLRVSRLDGRVMLTLPPGVADRTALAFLRERADWVRRALAEVQGPQRVGPGALLPVEGVPHRVAAGPVRRVTLAEGALLVPEGSPAGPRVAAFLRLRAQARLAEACARHAAAAGRPFGRISLRDTRSRWGSCTAAGDLMFSWRLILAPPPVLDYVAAHEVAHLVRMDHSPAFWDVVARLCPDYPARRDWLRREGGALHRWLFDA